jgi:hypothetical protein
MTRNYNFLTILALILLMIPLFGCEAAPTPDPSIVWSDDFEDGEMEDWGQDLNPGTFFFVEEGVLHAGPDRAGDIYHESNVSIGTWSFDVFFPTDESSYSYTITFCVSCDQDYSTGVGFETMVMNNTAASVVILDDGVLSRENEVFLGNKLSGWNHYDVTRDELGNTKVYLNEGLILEYSDELNISPQYFYLAADYTGPFFDNLVVRNQVVDIQPQE